ncbi:glycosyl transferase [Desulfosporosinus acidiphilus SJ4]|uniref:Glycosyl transferase n=1 Tax=Desulfosporosinus acidiphilus (strain DSM 22704 / JCM 16185 / SJ4) TaxID=646529 RepID=I4DB53_DESAJ|nr:glycosyltransferase family A protein [Desulfosporosinus acidiphilus]AFM43027.1 glycosyl transferase [Desulfosporosinus acidiphilus SJ4]
MEMNKIKLLSIVVPSYNSQDYLGHCLDTLIQGGPEIEVIVVDDGSTDNTAAVAQEYCDRFPAIVRLEQKENGGHGSAVNRGLEVATGEYFKVVDSDDWLDPSDFLSLLSWLRSNPSVDLLIANYVYEYSYNGKQKVMRYSNVFPEGKIISWDNMGSFRFDQLMLMHSMFYRTELLRQCGIKLPEHTFYVDNLIAYLPLPYVKSLVYLDLSPYHYLIGRAGQSVSTQVMIKRIDQQIKVTRMMIEAYNVFEDIEYKSLKQYMLFYLSMMVATTVTHLYIAEDKTLRRKADQLWDSIKQRDEKLYTELRGSFINLFIDITQKINPRILAHGLKLIKRIYKFS